MVQLPLDALLRELGQASLTVTLVGSLVASRVASQAPAFYAGVLDPLIALLTIRIEHGSIAKIIHLKQAQFIDPAGLPLDTTPHFPTPNFAAKDQR